MNNIEKKIIISNIIRALNAPVIDVEYIIKLVNKLNEKRSV
jgi:hypothetical protein